MATASSAQREPSMEEILASIRRIIEDSDSGRRPAESGEFQHASELEEAQDALPEVDAFRAELQADPQPFGQIALAEVQAQLQVADAADGADTDAAGGERAPISLAEIGNRIAQESQPAGDPAIAAESDPAGMVFERHEPELEYGQPSPVTVEAEAAAPPMETSPGMSAEALPARPALVSEQTSRQVAAAFEELSEAFASRSRKTFDEMAQEMLRPMLQDWLDNNLPTLVERLVREEIERVARGAGA
ncbi:hypothetical protein ATER59S_02149 [Aquamicrobium terrae]